MPAFFITISPAAIHLPILLLLAGENINLDVLPSPQRRAQIAAQNPVAAAQFLNIVIDAFIDFLLGVPTT